MFSILMITCVTCLGLDYSSASAATQNPVPEILKFAQVVSVDRNKQPMLKFGSIGDDVKTLTAQLQAEVEKKQIFVSLPPQPTTDTKRSVRQDLVWWLLVVVGVLGSAGALLYLVKWFGKAQKIAPGDTSSQETPNDQNTNLVTPPLQELDSTANQHSHSTNGTTPQAANTSEFTKLLPPENTSRLAKINIVDELIKDLGSTDPTKRRKAIWDLGQLGDSRAVQPLVDLMVDADSQQRSLILAALAEIGTRALKPMNRALAVSLQDESPQVRQNAIRDLTRIYDMMAQISQMLCHAVQDPDDEVQTTARYALTQMNRIRTLPSQEKPLEHLQKKFEK